jgi:lipid A 4'-phosphatase
MPSLRRSNIAIPDLMTLAEHQSRSSRQTTEYLSALLLWGALVTGALAAVAFLLFPAIDLDVARLFYRGNGIFVGKGGGIFTGEVETAADVIRLALYISFAAICIVTAVAIASALFWKRELLGLPLPKWIFLATCLAVGPGIISNMILKDHWGRARPVHVIEFGGAKTFSPPLVVSNQCHRNCSFVTGEASIVFVTFFAAALLFPAMGTALIGGGILAGLFSGLIRISQGAHFLSDVIFAGVMMALTVAALYHLFAAFARRQMSTAGHRYDPFA